MKKVLLIRTDNIGDVLYTLPCVKFIKQQCPEAKVSLMARSYVRDMLKLYPSLDEFIDWQQLEERDNHQIIEFLQQQAFDAVVHVLPKRRIVSLCHRAAIPIRVGTMRRVFSFLGCNKRVYLARRRSPLHEAQLNAKLLKGLGLNFNYSLEQCREACQLQRLEQQATSTRWLCNQRFNLIIHPGTHGHTQEWGPENFARVIAQLPQDKFNVILTGSEQERHRFADTALARLAVNNTMGHLSLAEFINLIQYSDGLVANGTGPLHLAAASNVQCLGLFPRAIQVSPSRWQALGTKASYLVTCKQSTQPLPSKYLTGISVDDVLARIHSWHA